MTAIVLMRVQKGVDETIKWLGEEYESIFKDGSGAMKVHRGKVHKYLGMSLDFSHKGHIFVTMRDYLDGTIETYDVTKNKHDDGFLYPSQNQWMRTVRSCRKKWQQTSTLSLQRHCM